MLGNRKVQHTVMLSRVKHLGPASEILRGVYPECNEWAQEDMGDVGMTRMCQVDM